MSSESQMESRDVSPARVPAEDAVFKWVEGVMPTENQLKIAERLGADESVLAEMKAGGMGRSAYYNVMAAEFAENVLARKYGQAFEAIDASVESSLDENQVVVTLEAVSGAFMRQAFTARVSWQAGGSPRCNENYFSLVRADEYADYVEGRLADAVAGCEGDVYVMAAPGSFLSVGDEFDADTPIERVASECEGILAIVEGPADGIDERAYRRDVDRVLAAAAEVNPGLFFESGYIETLEDPSEQMNARTAESYLHATRQGRRSLVVWRLSGVAAGGVEQASDAS